jgi:HK97 gp10 family phage protein
MAVNVKPTRDGVFATFKGLPDIRRSLLAVVPEMRVRALRNALGAAAGVVRKAARSRTPILKLTTYGGQSAYRRGIRKPGTVRDAISVRTSKVAKRRGNVGVFVNVRPVKGLNRSAKSRNDPFYWRWLEFGNKWKAGAGFLRFGASRLPDALDVFEKLMAVAFRKFNNKKKP